VVNIFLCNAPSAVNVLIQLSSTNFCIYISLFHYFLIAFNAVSECVISELPRTGLKTEVLAQMKVRKQENVFTDD